MIALYPVRPSRSGYNNDSRPEQLGATGTDTALSDRLRRIFRGYPVRGLCSRFIATMFALQGVLFCGLSALISTNCTK